MLGLTKTEQRVMMLLVGAFMIGSVIRWIQARYTPAPEPVVQARWIPPEHDAHAASSSGQESPASPDSAPFRSVALNTATREELMKVSGIGPVLADRIIRYRADQGGFRSVEELKNVRGIGPKTFETIKNEFLVQ